METSVSQPPQCFPHHQTGLRKTILFSSHLVFERLVSFHLLTLSISMIIRWKTILETGTSRWGLVWLNHTDSFFVSSTLGPQSHPLPVLHDWPSIFIQGMCPSQTKPLSSLTLAFTWYENWKNAFCWGRWLVVSKPWEKENCAMPISTDVLLLDVSYRCIYIFSFGPFKSLCTPLRAWVQMQMPLGHCPRPPILPVCKLPTVNFIIALYEATCFVLRSQSSFSVQREVSLPPNRPWSA